MGRGFTLPRLYPWIFLWSLGVIVYFFSIQVHYFEYAAHYFLFLIHLFLSTALFYFNFLAYQAMKEKHFKNFFFLIWMSLIPGAVSAELFSVLKHIVHIETYNHFSFTSSLIFPYLLFLGIQISAWIYLLQIQEVRLNVFNEASRVNTIFRFSVIALMLILFIVVVNKMILIEISLWGILSIIFEMIAFALIVICLIHSKNRGLIYIEFGFLLLISFNFTRQLNYLAVGFYYPIWDMVAPLCLVLLNFGFFYIARVREEKIVFFKTHSYYVLFCNFFILFSIALFIISSLFSLLIASLQGESANYLKIVIEKIPFVFIFPFLFAIVVGKKVADYITQPFHEISEKIEGLQQKNEIQASAAQPQAEELAKLENFILNQFQALHSANRVKSQFLMNMSHDFRTPVSGIYHLTQILYKKINDPELKRLQGLVMGSAEQWMQFLDNVLVYSRLDHSKNYSIKKELNLLALIEEVSTFLGSKADEKGLIFSINKLTDKISYQGDRDALYRILLNVLSNAVKFTDHGGIYISLDFQRQEDQGWHSIEVRDTGIGIDPAYHQLIFEPFFCIEPNAINPRSGLGLGLSNVSSILKNLGGKIKVKSQLHSGTTFIIYLPASDGLYA